MKFPRFRYLKLPGMCTLKLKKVKQCARITSSKYRACYMSLDFVGTIHHAWGSAQACVPAVRQPHCSGAWSSGNALQQVEMGVSCPVTLIALASKIVTVLVTGLLWSLWPAQRLEAQFRSEGSGLVSWLPLPGALLSRGADHSCWNLLGRMPTIGWQMSMQT